MVLDVSVIAHMRVEFDGGAGVVGVVTPVPVAQRREQRTLGSLMQLFATHDHPGSFRPATQIDEIGDLGDLGALRGVAGSASCRLPTFVRVAGMDSADRGVDAGVRAGNDREPDVTRTATEHEPGAATSRIGTDLHTASHHCRIVATT